MRLICIKCLLEVKVQLRAAGVTFEKKSWLLYTNKLENHNHPSVISWVNDNLKAI